MIRLIIHFKVKLYGTANKEKWMSGKLVVLATWSNSRRILVKAEGNLALADKDDSGNEMPRLPARQK